MITVKIGEGALPRAKPRGQELKWEELSLEQLSTIASTPALFGGAQTYALAGALYGERGEEFLQALQVFAESPHTFVFEEEKLLKAERTALERAGAKVEEEKKVKKESGFDPFGVSAALAARDRKRLWLALSAALRAGQSPEALCGLLAWKARQMRDPPLSRALVCLYHDSHRGAGSLELLLERFALKL